LRWSHHIIGFALRRDLRLDRTDHHAAEWQRRRADQYRINAAN
jgi:hypothetical protein